MASLKVVRGLSFFILPLTLLRHRVHTGTLKVGLDTGSDEKLELVYVKDSGLRERKEQMSPDKVY